VGWQPRDLVRHARRAFPFGEQPVVVAIAAHGGRHVDPDRLDARWRAQLHEIGVIDDTTWARGPVVDPEARDLGRELIRALHLLSWLADLGTLPGAPEGRPPWERDPSARGGAEVAESLDAVVAKVRGLLAKAESTEFPAEAEAFSAKAQELITRHAIDHALLVESQGEEPVSRRVHLDDPYPEAKAQLLAHIASANRCHAVWSSSLGFATLIGFPADLDSVELLHASLLVQATRAVAAIGRNAPPGSRVRGVAFRRSFLVGFAAQIGERLRDAAAAQTQQAADRHGNSLLPVLAKRDDAVVEERDRLFPRLRTMGQRISDGEGWIAGNAAGRRASLALDDEVAPSLRS
jgi:hypothetical protein